VIGLHRQKSVMKVYNSASSSQRGGQQVSGGSLAKRPTSRNPPSSTRNSPDGMRSWLSVIQRLSGREAPQEKACSASFFCPALLGHPGPWRPRRGAWNG
jgi:hypothetical protein